MSKDKKTRFTDQSPLYNSGFLRAYFDLLRKQYPEVDLERVYKEARLSPFAIHDEAHWFTQAQLRKLHEVLEELDLPHEFPFLAGKHAVNAQVAGAIRSYAVGFLTTKALYKGLENLTEKWSRGYNVSVTTHGDNHAEISVSTEEGVHEQLSQCLNRQGIFTALSRPHTGRDATLKHPECIHKGDSTCRYEVTWQPTTGSILKRVSSWTWLFAGVATLGTAFWLTPVNFAIAVLLLLTFSLFVMTLSQYVEKSELKHTFEEEGSNAVWQLESADAKYKSALLFQEIGSASNQIRDEATLQLSVLNSVKRHLTYRRGLLLMSRDGEQTVRCTHCFGFPKEYSRELRRHTCNIAPEQVPAFMNRLFESHLPHHVNNLGHVARKYRDAFLDQLVQYNFRSCYFLPICHKKDRMGLLLLETTGLPHVLTKSELNLLHGLSSIFATEIHNMRSLSRLEESERRYRLLAENADDVIWTLHIEQLQLTYVSPSSERMFGWPPEEYAKLSFEEFMTISSAKKALDLIARALNQVESGEQDAITYSETIELELYTRSGKIITAEITAGFLVNAEGYPTHVVGISRDVSERKEYEQRLQQAKKMESLGVLAGAISHKFNNILMGVLGNLDLALLESWQLPPIERLLKEAKESTLQASHLSNMMLAYVGQLKRELVPVEINALIKDVCRDFVERLPDDKRCVLKLSPLEEVQADRAQLRLVLKALLENSLEALEGRSGTITIASSVQHIDTPDELVSITRKPMRAGPHVVLTVEDTGCGIAPETLPKIFDPFFSTKFTGRGLGLSAVLGITKAHNGGLFVESTQPAGTTFTLMLPMTIPQADPVTP